jgi:hypothetical protein
MNNPEFQPKGHHHHITMKHIDMNRVRAWCGMLLAGWLLAGLAPAARAGLFFSGPFAPGHWTQTSVSANNGVFGFAGSGSSTVMTLLSSTTTGFSDTLVGAANTSGATESVSFNWTLTAYGNLGAPQAYFYAGSTIYDLIGTSGRLNDIQVAAGTTIYFELVGNVSSGKAPAQLNIMEVPEASTALAGLLVLAVAGLEWFRRKQTAGG